MKLRTVSERLRSEGSEGFRFFIFQFFFNLAGWVGVKTRQDAIVFSAGPGGGGAGILICHVSHSPRISLSFSHSDVIQP